ncbi:MAG: enterochelin esterase [Planctomycetota bacterium]|nr:MAG: enterochelin esterase [Planctomycetota bacterium]
MKRFSGSRSFLGTAAALYLALAPMPLCARAGDDGATAAFEVRFAVRLRAEPFTGRVLLFLNSDTQGEPRLKSGWTSRQPLFSQDVRDWKPDTPLRLDRLRGFPVSLRDVPPGRYAVQAVMHVNPDLPHSGDAPGNLYSAPLLLEFDPKRGGPHRIDIEHRVTTSPAETDTELERTVSIRSACLSRFHGRDVLLRCRVQLPDDYPSEPSRRFPAIYSIPGFGGDEREALRYLRFLGAPTTPVVRVGLAGMCALGHHAWADSANNGPWGQALVEELIPHLEKELRLIPEPWARLLTGHSSGGWSSLWVQISHPDYFGGVWATSPDSVDFHDFSGINLYDPASNFYRSADSRPRPIMRRGNDIVLKLEDFARMEDVIGPGGQLGSFEAVFGPRGPDGRPRRLWDRDSGAIDPETVAHWRRYDIVDRLRRDWALLGPKLAGKITVIMGEEDNFFLEGATRRLKSALQELGSDARIILVPGCDHGSILVSEPARRMIEEMCAKARSATLSNRPRSGSDGRPAPGGP